MYCFFVIEGVISLPYYQRRKFAFTPPCLLLPPAALQLVAAPGKIIYRTDQIDLMFDTSLLGRSVLIVPMTSEIRKAWSDS